MAACSPACAGPGKIPAAWVKSSFLEIPAITVSKLADAAVTRNKDSESSIPILC